jgi:hypothetical protein
MHAEGDDGPDGDRRHYVPALRRRADVDDAVSTRPAGDGVEARW